mmetsp:Transcript_22066/g.44249  ORF Transcript_22066/g.44249 Transcript_22066/m.44249 type:complete len:118 (-) Transcript_22066:449-802(-)
MTSQPTEQSPPSDESAAQALGECILNQFAFCFAGVALGASYTIISRGRLKHGQQPSLRRSLNSPKKSIPSEESSQVGKQSSLRPLVIGGISGSGLDIIYGYNIACVKERDSYLSKRN